MKIFLNPEQDKWYELCSRPEIDRADLDQSVRSILNRVKSEGDAAIREYSLKYDKVLTDEIRVSQKEIDESGDNISGSLKEAINIAKTNIEKFHLSQMTSENPIETMPGVKCWRKNLPVEKVGLYIPGGTAPLFSTVLMLAIPAKIAGCKQVIICTPAGKNGTINPLITYCAALTGITEIYKVGGAQAIAAMAFGTESIPKVYKIFGPGNQYVTKAKEIVQSYGTAIDMPAGPSEVLVIADGNANPGFIAADLLSQAEHGADSQVVLLTDSIDLQNSVLVEVEKQLEELPRKDIASKALSNSMSIMLPSLDECIDFSNMYAPEHLIINTDNALTLADNVTNAGSVFIGKYSCESAGDYASGTNHTLPTNAYARNFGGVSTESFIKKTTFQQIDEEGIKSLGPSVELMAEAESLYGHKNAVSLRLKSIKNV